MDNMDKTVVDNKLRHFSSSVMSQARFERDEILRDIENTKASSLSKAESEILDEVYHYIQNEMVKISNENKQEISSEVFSLRRQSILKRDAMVDNIFSEVIDKISAFTQSDEYGDYLVNCLRTGIPMLDGHKITVYMRESDSRFVEKLETCVENCILQLFYTDDIQYGGLIISSDSTHRIVDMSFDHRLDELREEFIKKSGLCID